MLIVVVSSSSSWEANDDAVDNEVADGIDMAEASDEDVANTVANAVDVPGVAIANISSIVDLKQHDDDDDTEDG